MRLAWYLAPVNDRIVAAAQELLKKPGTDHAKLRQIINGKVKNVDVRWWRAVNGVAAAQLNTKMGEKYKKKLDAIKAMTDPAGNPNPHSRRVAAATLAKMQAAGPPKGMRSAPGLEEYDREQVKRRPPPFSSGAAARKNRPMQTYAIGPVNTTTKPQAVPTQPRPATKPVNTTAPKPRSADRHLEPNRDRHSPGYMRDYMRRRREEARKAKPGR